MSNVTARTGNLFRMVFIAKLLYFSGTEQIQSFSEYGMRMHKHPYIEHLSCHSLGSLFLNA